MYIYIKSPLCDAEFSGGSQLVCNKKKDLNKDLNARSYAHVFSQSI